MMNERLDFSLLNRFGLEPLLIDPAHIRFNSRNSASQTLNKKKINNLERLLELDKLEREINATEQHHTRLMQLVELEIDNLARSKDKLRGLRELDEDKMLSMKFAELHKDKKRVSALYQVLCALPENDYRELKSLGSFYYYLPDNTTLASVKRLSIGVTYIYLSSQLEDLSDDWIRYVVAHELSHAKLGHIDRPSSHQSKDIIEKEADLKAAQWGFKCPE